MKKSGKEVEKSGEKVRNRRENSEKFYPVITKSPVIAIINGEKIFSNKWILRLPLDYFQSL